MNTHDRYAQQAARWIEEGRPERGLMGAGLPLAALYCWYQTQRRQQLPGLAPAIGEYLVACEARLPPDWYDTILWQRSYCTACGTRYKIENLRLCTRCQEVYCYRCASERQRAANGERLCRCGGELTG